MNLKPCPFCGSAVTLRSYGDEWLPEFVISCSRCATDSVPFRSAKDAADYWAEYRPGGAQ